MNFLDFQAFAHFFEDKLLHFICVESLNAQRKNSADLSKPQAARNAEKMFKGCSEDDLKIPQQT